MLLLKKLKKPQLNMNLKKTKTKITRKERRRHLLRSEVPHTLLFLPPHQGPVAPLVEVPVHEHRHVLLTQLVQDNPSGLDGTLQHGRVDHVELEPLRQQNLHLLKRTADRVARGWVGGVGGWVGVRVGKGGGGEGVGGGEAQR